MSSTPMSDGDEPDRALRVSPRAADAALDAAAAGVWSWDAKTQRLTIAGDGGGAFSDLSGAWALSAFAQRLEGLDSRPLTQVFDALSADVRVDATLRRVGGETLRFIGRYDAPGLAQGVLLAATNTAPKPTDAGFNLYPVYQPMIALRTGEVVGFEALARWRGPAGEIWGPGQVREAQASQRGGGPSRLATAMLGEAARVLARWRKRRPDLVLNVNLSALDLNTPGLVEAVGAVIADYELPAKSLRIELTEESALRDPNAAFDTLRRLSEVGAGVVLDDFGAGHASLVWLSEAPALGVKLDRDIAALVETARGRTILSAMISLAASLDLTVTAEGVETQSQAAKLAEIGCDFGQGFVFSPPLSEPEALRRL